MWCLSTTYTKVFTQLNPGKKLVMHFNLSVKINVHNAVFTKTVSKVQFYLCYKHKAAGLKNVTRYVLMKNIKQGKEFTLHKLYC